MNEKEDANASKAIEDWMIIMMNDLEDINRKASIRYNYDFIKDIPLAVISSEFCWLSDDLSPKELILKQSILIDKSSNISQPFKKA